MRGGGAALPLRGDLRVTVAISHRTKEASGQRQQDQGPGLVPAPLINAVAALLDVGPHRIFSVPVWPGQEHRGRSLRHEAGGLEPF